MITFYGKFRKDHWTKVIVVIFYDTLVMLVMTLHEFIVLYFDHFIEYHD